MTFENEIKQKQNLSSDPTELKQFGEEHMKKVLLFFAIMMMAITASARDMVFDTNDTWSRDNSTKSISCTKDGITLTIAGSRFTPTVMKNDAFDFGPEGTATITVNAGTATVTGISVAGEPDFNNLDLTGAGPWTCPIEMGGLKKDGTSMPVNQIQSFTVHIGNTPTGITEVNATNSQKNVKFLKEGKLVIMKEGKLYNAAGQKM